MSLREFFESEAGASLKRLRDAVEPGAMAVDSLIRSARVLRGSALLAGEERVHGIAGSLVDALNEPSLETDAEFRARLAATLDDIDALIAKGEAEVRLEERARAAAARWTGSRRERPAEPETERNRTDGFVAREAAAIAETLNGAFAAFQADPWDRGWLGAVLRRQRALLGSVQIESMPVLGESLRAVEDLTELIVRLDVPVKAEWLDIFRSARDVVRAAHGALERGDLPVPVPALSRLRTLRDELLSRYVSRDPEGARPLLLEQTDALAASGVDADAIAFPAGSPDRDSEDGSEVDPRDLLSVIERALPSSEAEARAALTRLLSMLERPGT